MAVLVQNTNGHLQSQLTRSLERILEEASQSGELRLSNRKLRDFPKYSDKYNLCDTVIADLSKNRLSELPEEVVTFQFLEKLLCYDNAIRFAPDGLINLQCLNFLDLSRNQLNSLPREICQLPIQILLVSNNRLKSLPDDLSKMSRLTELDASCNQLAHLPPRMCELRNLQSLILRNNQLLAVPIEVTLLRLTRLDLRANRIGTLPVELKEMDSLIHLFVEDNPLTSPPASLCKRGLVHIFKFLETEAQKMEAKCGGALMGGGTLGRRAKKPSTGGSPGPTHFDRLKQKRYNVDSGYSTSSDDKRWSQEMTGDLEKQWPNSHHPHNHNLESTSLTNGTNSTMSTPSTISPAPENVEDHPVQLGPAVDQSNQSNGFDEKKPLHQIQTYREYKEALKQQRAQEVPSIYRTKDSNDQTYKTEPNTPTHRPQQVTATLATSKSDPTPLNSALLAGSKAIFDDTDKSVPIYVKPNSPFKTTTSQKTILSHDNVPPAGNNNKQPSRTNNNINGSTKTNSVNWGQELSFTMRREIDKAREETDLMNQLRNIIETRLKMALPSDLASSLTDGVVLCHLANHIRPRSVASIHVPSPAVPKLTMARCRRNVDNFIEACRKIGVDEGRLCTALDVTEALEGRGLSRLHDTVTALCRLDVEKRPAVATARDATVSLLLLAIFFGTMALLIIFPPPAS